MNERSDAELVASAASGDKDSFGCLIERHQKMAERVAKGVIGAGDVARDLAQEAVLQAYLSLDRLRNPERFQSWLYGIVLNVCRSHIRDQKTAFYSLEAMTGGLRFESLPLTDVEPDPQEVAEAQELHGTVLGAVNGLSPKVRAATLLFYYEQLSTQEIAATLGISAAAVKGRLHKARSRLRELLRPVGLERDDSARQKEGSVDMVKVTVADVRSRGVTDDETGRSFKQDVVLLLDEEARRVLPVWIGPAEGRAIVAGLKEVDVPRPMTLDFVARLLEAAGAKLEEARIQELKGDTFYAVAKLRTGDAAREIDARPSDVIALAVRTGSPIYVAREVMEKAGVDVPEPPEEPLGAGLDKILLEIQEEMGSHSHIPDWH